MKFDRPLAVETGTPAWGSDIAAQMLRELDLRYIALNPGASFRGLHDSLVNHLGNSDPSLLLCLHEEHAVAIAHGYYKATGRPMAVALHSNVGLMHGSMAVFNAWCDRAAMVIVGATGPVDAALRRPWIDWIHTARDQGALARPFLKWDDQPASVPAMVESFRRAARIATTAPCGPTYVCLDAALQEQPFADPALDTSVARYAAPRRAAVPVQTVADAIAMIARAERVVLLVGRSDPGEESWDARVALAESLGAAVLTDLKTQAAFPTDHPQHPAPVANFLSSEAKALLRDADLIVALEWVDLGGTLRQAFGGAVPVPVIHASVDQHAHNGWSMDHQSLPPVDLPVLCESDAFVEALLAALPAGSRRAAWCAPSAPEPYVAPLDKSARPTLRDVAAALSDAAGERKDVTFATLPRGWPVQDWPFRSRLDYLGKDGGGGVGSGLGLAIGAALALAESERLVVSVIGDGDFLMGQNALWTAAHHQIPLLVIVANNCSYYNDELHQESVARNRGRNPANRWIGQAIIDPVPDLAQIAAGQGLEAFGPITTIEALEEALRDGVARVRAGQPCLIDVRIATGAERALGEAMQDRSLARAG